MQTKILTLMFHRVNDASLGYDPHQFSRYLAYLVEHFPIVIPGQTLPKVPLAICLTFDDAYFDFYQDVYPLLVKYQVKALLAVPVKYIVDNTDLNPSVRLSVPYAYEMENPNLQAKVPLCTWQELKEMVQSQQVVIASHGYQHANLAEKSSHYSQEIILSQAMLQQKLNVPITHFVYPFGRISTKAHQIVCENYAYGLRIGSALNIGWDDTRKFIYRINADPLWTNHQLVDDKLIRKLTLKYWINRIRFK